MVLSGSGGSRLYFASALGLPLRPLAAWQSTCGALLAHSPTSSAPESAYRRWQRPNVEPQLPARLEAVRRLCARPLPTASGSASRVHVVADIACDHCTLSIALLKSGVAQRVIAVDVCASPLATGQAKAARQLAPALRSCLELRLGDGLAPLAAADGVDTVCVVGVGAYSVLQILDPATPETPEGINVDRRTGRLVGPAAASSTAAGHAVGVGCAARALGVQRLVLQPVDSRPHQLAPLRRWLRARGWRVADETLSGGGAKPLYLTLLAERDHSGGLDQNGAERPGSSSGDSDADYLQDLVLPRTLRERVHRALRARASQPPGVRPLEVVGRNAQRGGVERAGAEFAAKGAAEDDNAAGDGADADEVWLWQAYVQLHRDWIAVARFDSYDKTCGLPPGAIAAVLAAECDALRALGVDL